jgi:hypothetical protein
METAMTGKVVVTAKIENLGDLYSVEPGLLPDDKVRRIEVQDAVIDTGATTLLLPKRMIAALGLKPLRTRHSRGLGGDFLLHVYGTVRLTIQGRDCALDSGRSVMSIPSSLARSRWSRSTGSSRRRGNG